MLKPEAHHDLPQAFRDKFEAVGLDIDAPQYGRWVSGNPQGQHQSWSDAFNQEWKTFFSNPENLKKEKILEQMYRMRNKPEYQ
jgi:hypothetical protein